MDLPSVQLEFLKKIDIALPGGVIFSPTYAQAGLVVFLLFLVILTFSFIQRRHSEVSVKSILPGFVLGIVTILLVEGILIVSGSSVLISVLGWKDAPKPISNALDTGRSELVKVLGATSSENKRPTVGNIMNEYQDLQASEQDSLKLLICNP